MADESFEEEWPQDILDQIIQLEEKALSSSTSHHFRPPPPPPSDTAGLFSDISYSPPRELSQRVNDYNTPTKVFEPPSNGIGSFSSAVPYFLGPQNDKETELDRLKREFGRVSKQLTHLEQECLELRKERDEKEAQLKSVFPQIGTKDADKHCRKNTNLEYEMHLQDHPGISLGCPSVNLSNNQVASRINIGKSACKAVGVQTDKTAESPILNIESEPSTSYQCSSKLLGVWESTSGQNHGRNLVSKLFFACEKDFRVLLGCLNSSLSNKTTMNSTAYKSSSDVASQDHLHTPHSAEAAKLSYFYSVLTKTSNEMEKLEALIEALVDLCGLENVVVVYRSLRVLHMVLNHLFGIQWESDKRDNVMVEGPFYKNSAAEIYGSQCSEVGNLFYENFNKASVPGHFSFGTRLFTMKYGLTLPISCVDWIALFELMRQIAMRNNEEYGRLEAVSIMNLILMRTNAYLEREKFGTLLVFQSVSQLLRKEAGLCVQKQAVHLLYLLLNCPKLMAIFCSTCKDEGESVGAANNNAETASVVQGFSVILEGLADCVACSGNGAQGLKLQRNAIIVLAFLASSGKSGFEILLGHTRTKRSDFLTLILQILISEMNIEASDSSMPPEIFKERALLIREALILLNRLVSSPQYSNAVFRILTNRREVASLTLDVANRLSRKGRWLWQPDKLTRQIREFEIVDLARVFKKRVSSFLGESLS